MNWTGWLIVAAIGVGVLTIQFIPELFLAAGNLLDRLPPKLGFVILGPAVVVSLLAGMIVLCGR